MKIVKIERSKHKQERVLVYPEEGDLLRITEAELLQFGLYPGMELSGEEEAALRDAARRSETKLRAARMASARMLSKKELTDRLRRRGAGADEAAEAAARMEDLGAVNDAAYAGILARHYAAMGYGPGRVEQELYRRGIPKELWDAALRELPDSADAIDAFLRSKLRGRVPDRAERKKLSDALLRRGFPWSDIRPALNRLGGDEIDSDE
ncbi:MAG: regulatory protein RecX [Ruminococcaceae bacterium]|jgi:regulatory protein|nr:regulatory protein RecX [Oscillospiraceae bacterium]